MYIARTKTMMFVNENFADTKVLRNASKKKAHTPPIQVAFIRRRFIIIIFFLNFFFSFPEVKQPVPIYIGGLFIRLLYGNDSI